MDNALIVYFSTTGTTEGIAKDIAEITRGDLYQLLPADPYTSSDLNYSDPNCRALREQNDPLCRPEIADDLVDLVPYEVVFLGYPIWDGKAPKIMSTFLERSNLSAKTIVPFVTSASNGIGSSAVALQPLAAGAQWQPGKRFGGMTSPQAVEAWVAGLKL